MTQARPALPFGVAFLLLLAAGGVLYATAIPGGTDYRLLFGMWRASGLGGAVLLALAAVGVALAGVSHRSLMAYAFSLVLTLAGLAVLEVAGLSGLVSYPELMGNAHLIETNDLGAHAVPHLDVRGTTTQDTATGWGLESEPIPFHYQTDRRGFRNPTDPDSARIYLVGDSVVVGALVAHRETVGARLAKDTGRSTLNVALIGLSPQEELQKFRESDLPVADRLVLHFLFEGNDLLDSKQFREQGADPSTRELPLRARSFTNNAIRVLQRLTQPVVGLAARRVCTIDGQTYTFRWTQQSYQGLSNEQDVVLDLLRDFSAQVQAAGGNYAVVLVPGKLRVLGPFCEEWPAESDLEHLVEANPMRAALHEFGSRLGIPIIDLTDPLRESMAAGKPPWFWGDTHWNAQGHTVAAAAIAGSPSTQSWVEATSSLPLNQN